MRHGCRNMECLIKFHKPVHPSELLDRLDPVDPAEAFWTAAEFRHSIVKRDSVSDIRNKWLKLESTLITNSAAYSAMFIVGGRKSIPLFLDSLYNDGHVTRFAWTPDSLGLSLQCSREAKRYFHKTRTIVQLTTFALAKDTTNSRYPHKLILGTSLFPEGFHGHAVTFRELATIMRNWFATVLPE